MDLILKNARIAGAEDNPPVDIGIEAASRRGASPRSSRAWQPTAAHSTSTAAW